MDNFYLKVRKDGKFYFNALLKADFKDEAIKQANEIMNKFDLTFTAEIIREKHDGTKSIVTYFQGE